MSIYNVNSLEYKSEHYNVKNFARFLFIVLLLMSTFRTDTLPDYYDYVRIFTYDDLEESRYEIGNRFIISIIREFTLNRYVYFFVFGFIGVSLKMYAIYKYSPSFFLSMLIYLVGYFVILDMIQVRNSIAISFFLLAIIFRVKENWKLCILFMALSISFHYSAAIVLLLFFLSKDKFIKYYKWVIPVSYGLALAGKAFGFLAGYLPGPFQLLFLMNSEENNIDIFNTVALARIAFFYIIYSNYDIISSKYPYTGIMLKIDAIGISTLALLADSPSIAFRLNHFLLSVEIFLLPTVIYIKKKPLYKTLLYMYCLGMFIIFLMAEDMKL